MKKGGILLCFEDDLNNLLFLFVKKSLIETSRRAKMKRKQKKRESSIYDKRCEWKKYLEKI